jgi:hypothetical protein
VQPCATVIPTEIQPVGETSPDDVFHELGTVIIEACKGKTPQEVCLSR